MGQVAVLSGVRVLFYEGDAQVIEQESQGSDLLGLAYSEDAEVVAIAVDRLGSDFLRLESRLAGEVFQKFANHGLRCAIVGDVEATAADSSALRAYMVEANRGNTVWFVSDLQALEARLQQASAATH